jgi:hypothetical protein
MAASGALSTVAAEENPLGFAGTASGTGDQAFKMDTQIQQENNSWKNDLIGGLTGIAGSALKGFGAPKSSNSNSGASALDWAAPGSGDYGQPG